jgi:RES domain-containing protein
MYVNRDELDKVAPQKIDGSFYRLIRTRYANEPLSMFGSIAQGGRYNVAGLFGALYLGFDSETCHAEITQGILAGLPVKKGSLKLWEYSAELQKVIRLDDPDILSAIGVTVDETTIPGNHQTASLIGEPLYLRRVEGLVAPSAQRRSSLCLDVFLDHVKLPSFIKPLKMSDFESN